MSVLNPVDGDAMAEWSAMLRDDNAIHLSREAAAAAGFGARRVNPGPANLAFLIAAALHADPDADFATITADFTGNVFEGDALAVTLADDTATLTRDGEAVLGAHFTRRRTDEP